MSSTYGKIFKISTFGESHGRAVGVVIDGCPAGVVFDELFIQQELLRRKPGQSRITTQRKENDTFEVLSGVFDGKTTGTPIALVIFNEDQRSKDYSNIKDQFRPAHADYTYMQKYGVRDPRGGGRSSARLTAPTVAAGAVAKKWLLEKFGTTFKGCMTQIGEQIIGFESWEHVPNNPFFAPVADVSAAFDVYWNDPNAVPVSRFEGKAPKPEQLDRLMQLARGRELDVFDRSIDVQVSRLRRLIESDPAHPRYLQTMWGFGYVFIPDGEVA